MKARVLSGSLKWWRLSPVLAVLLVTVLQQSEARAFTVKGLQIPDELPVSLVKGPLKAQNDVMKGRKLALPELIEKLIQLQTEHDLREDLQRPVHQSASAVEGNAPPKGSSRSYSLEKQPSDIVSENDDREAAKIAERNYYGWMDFGK